VSVSSFIDDLPIETWAAAVGRTARRFRRRVVRQPARALGGAGAIIAFALVGSNALFRQEAPHPAPLWGERGAEEPPLVGAHQPVRDAGDAARGEAARAQVRTEPDPLVAQVQNALLKHGYYRGSPDGWLDEATTEAIRAFEAERGLVVTGEPGLALLGAPVTDDAPRGRAAAADAGARAEGIASDSGTLAPVPAIDVSQIQSRLNEAGFGPLAVDGVMGPRTLDALDRFARARGIDGRGLTPAVLRALAEEER